MKPILFLDVDGPLNPYAEKPWRRPDGYTTHRLRPAGWEWKKKPLRVWLNPSHGPLLLDFASRHDLELVWATTWEHDANKYIAPVLGLPELSVVEFSSHKGTGYGWKFPAVRDFAAGRSLAWLDDDFSKSYVVNALSSFRLDRGDSPTFLKSINPRVGLLEKDLEEVGVWLDSVVGKKFKWMI